MKPQHQPYPHTPCTYGAKQQYVDNPDLSAPLDKQDTTFIQEVIGVFLYYARAVDCTMLTALSSLATQQAKSTQTTLQRINRFLDYAMTHQDAVITYRASNMILAAHSDASYLSETMARSRAGGHFFLSENDAVPRNNGAILTLVKIIKSVISSAAEAKLGALYINAREAIPIQHLLKELGHTQPPTPIQIDNSTALGVVSNIIQPKHTKAMDMRFHWLRCRTNQYSSAHIGAPEQQTWPTMSQNIMRPSTIAPSVHYISLTQPNWCTYKQNTMRHPAPTSKSGHLYQQHSRQQALHRSNFSDKCHS
eukprot:CCRYP_017300-RA/>CCRYP_017300-RA protein AED:0.41 eAED:0.44 QI:0/-1/0/1/-1/1/1/0/306